MFFSQVEESSVVEGVTVVLEVQPEVDGVTEGCQIPEEGGTTWDNTPRKQDMIATRHIVILMQIICMAVTCHTTLRIMQVLKILIMAETSNRGQFL
jgi:hypothetical protein